MTKEIYRLNCLLTFPLVCMSSVCVCVSISIFVLLHKRNEINSIQFEFTIYRNGNERCASSNCSEQQARHRSPSLNYDHINSYRFSSKWNERIHFVENVSAWEIAFPRQTHPQWNKPWETLWFAKSGKLLLIADKLQRSSFVVISDNLLVSNLSLQLEN